LNKTQFIEYIILIPEDIEFTPMSIDVRGHSPQPDGTYRTMTKKISFECEYTEQVHKLPCMLEKPRDSSDDYFQSLIEVESQPICEFQKTSTKLRKSIIRRFKKEGCGDNPVIWDAIPIYVLSELLNDAIHRKNREYFKSVVPEVMNVVNLLGYTLINRNWDAGDKDFKWIMNRQL
jgi:hypothetical protein